MFSEEVRVYIKLLKKRYSLDYILNFIDNMSKLKVLVIGDTILDEKGVCDACRYAEKKEKIDWNKREKELIKLCDKYRRTDGYYDCIVPGSGGKDSDYAAHILKYKYEMNPLTVTWPPIMYTDYGYKNFRNWIEIGGFDNITFNQNGRVHLRTQGTYSKYNSIDDKIDDLHYHTTYIKFGLGRASYDASQEIRNKHLTREEGVALVKRFDGEFPDRYLDEVLEYIDMKPEKFYELCEKGRSPHLWKKEGSDWRLNHPVWE